VTKVTSRTTKVLVSTIVAVRTFSSVSCYDNAMGCRHSKYSVGSSDSSQIGYNLS